MRLKQIPTDGRGHLPMTVVFNFDKTGSYSHFRLVDHCVFLSCNSTLATRSHGFHLKYLRTSCCHLNLPILGSQDSPCGFCVIFKAFSRRKSPSLPSPQSSPTGNEKSSTITGVNAVSTRQIPFKVQLSN